MTDGSGLRGLGVLLILLCLPVSLSAGVNCWNTNEQVGPGGLWTVIVDPETPTTMYAGGYGGVFKSLDGGQTWRAINNGLPQDTNGAYYIIGSLLIDPTYPTTLYASGDVSVFKTTDGGSSWIPAHTNLPGGGTVIFMSPHDPKTLFASSVDSLFASTDGAATWCRSIGGLPECFNIGQIAWDPVDPDLLYAAATLCDITYGNIGAVFRSRDGGAVWELLWEPFDGYFPLVGVFDTVVVDPFAPSTLCAAGERGYGDHCIFKSTDSGATWNAIDAGIPEGTWINSLMIDSSNPDLLYAVGGTDTPDWGWSGGVFRTTDGGTTWAAIHQGLPKARYGIGNVALDPLDPAHLYLAYTSVFTISLVPVAGDCDGDFKVSIGEIQRAVNMFLSLQAPGCGVDTDGDGTVSIGEVQAVINGFLGLTYPCP